MLFGVKSTDPASLFTLVVLLLTVAVLAGYFPAKRASRVDRMEALRYELPRSRLTREVTCSRSPLRISEVLLEEEIDIDT